MSFSHCVFLVKLIIILLYIYDHIYILYFWLGVKHFLFPPLWNTTCTLLWSDIKKKLFKFERVDVVKWKCQQLHCCKKEILTEIEKRSCLPLQQHILSFVRIFSQPIHTLWQRRNKNLLSSNHKLILLYSSFSTPSRWSLQ